MVELLLPTPGTSTVLLSVVVVLLPAEPLGTGTGTTATGSAGVDEVSGTTVVSSREQPLNRAAARAAAMRLCLIIV